MGHNRIRVVDAHTGIITTVAGDGRLGGRGDGGPAVAASLGGPASLALVSEGRQVTIFIAEYFNGSVRVVDPNGVVSTLGEPGRFTAPSRLAYRAGGWLYVASDTRIGDRLQRGEGPSVSDRHHRPEGAEADVMGLIISESGSGAPALPHHASRPVSSLDALVHAAVSRAHGLPRRHRAHADRARPAEPVAPEDRRGQRPRRPDRFPRLCPSRSARWRATAASGCCW